MTESRESLFDSKLTIVDVFKFLILIYTGYATYTLVQGISTSATFWSTVRPFAAVAFVEGGLLIFEYMFGHAKNDPQVKTAKWGYIISIFLIVFLSIASILVEISKSLLSTDFVVAGFSLSARDGGELLAGVLVAGWVGICMGLRLRYQTQDPDDQFAREQKKAEGVILAERNRAFQRTAEALKGTFAVAEVLRQLEVKISSAGLSPAEAEKVRQQAQRELSTFYGHAIQPPPAVRVSKREPAPLPEPSREKLTVQ